MRMQIFRVKKPICKILKTKNCVPFEVQYTSIYQPQYHYRSPEEFGRILGGPGT